MPKIMNSTGLDLWSNGVRHCADGADAEGSCFSQGNCNEFYMNIIMYFAKDPWMSTVDDRGR